MKTILSIIISATLVVSGYSQTRNVLVGTNNSVVQPTNFWSADASNARTGLGLGTAATNPASAFQPSSATLSNLASNNAVNLTNLRATNLIGLIPTSNIPSTTLTNISGTLAITQGGTGATNAAGARTNLGLGATWLTNALSPLFTDTNGRIVAPLVVFDNANESEVLRIPSDTSDSVDPVVLGGGWNTSNNRTRLGLGPTNSPRFAGITLQLDEQSLSNSIVAAQQDIEFKVANVTKLAIGASNASFYVPLVFFGTNTAATTRTNFGLGWSALTNTTASGFQTALFGTNTNAVLVNTNGEVVSPTNFWQVAPISTTVQYQTNVTGTSTNAATNSRNLFLFSLAPSVSGVTNTVTLPTNAATTFEGDRATIIHLATNSANAVTAIRQLGAATNLITLNQVDEAVLLMYRGGQWGLADNLSFIEPIYFSGTNASANAAASRTNLGLGATWLTNTDVTNFRTAIGLGTTNVVSFSTVEATDVESINVLVGLGGISFEDDGQSVTRTNLGIPLAALTNTSVTNFQKAIFYTNTAPSNIGGNLGTIAAWIEIVASNGVTYKVPAYTNVP